KDAYKAACTHLVSRLHTTGFLKTLFADRPTSHLDQQTLQEEADAKIDIYNYAARFGLVPQFHVEVKSFFRVKGRQGASKKLVTVSVKLEEHNIDVKASNTSMKTAEIAAAIEFKREAEKYHSARGDASLVIAGSDVLTTDNAKQVLEFFRLENPGARFEVRTKTVHVNGVDQSISRVALDDEYIGEEVVMPTKKKAEAVAELTAAVALTKRDQTLMSRYGSARKSASGEILKPVNPVDLSIDSDAMLVMRESLYEARESGLRDEREELTSDNEFLEIRKSMLRRTLTTYEAVHRSARLEERQKAYLADPELEGLRGKRNDLPMNQYRAAVLELIGSNTYSIVVGATGSGKTTQVPQILLEDAISKGEGAKCNIICTQPRRIAATSVAQRVAVERNEALQDTVGYHVRFDARYPAPGGSITYCTTGILLQRLQHAPDDVLNGTSHLIIDEVHERDMFVDFLLIVLKKIMQSRQEANKSVPKVVLMSATLDTELFANYFEQTTADGKALPCPHLSVPGRTFPVKEKYFDEIMSDLETSFGNELPNLLASDPATKEYIGIEQDFSRRNAVDSSGEPLEEARESVIDWKRDRGPVTEGEQSAESYREEALVPLNLVAATISHIAQTTSGGAILAFLPGLEEIVKVNRMLCEEQALGVDFNDQSKFKLSMLHSSVPREDQQEVFESVPAGCRKVILSTNIAETSVTIPDVQYVVDTGKLRDSRYDQVRRITKLQCVWVSKSNSKQRAGRAGRVQNGNYYALFSKPRYESLRAIGIPELLRSDLQATCLAVKAQAFQAPVRQFLADAIEPPSSKAVDASVTNLQALEALTENEELTPLGRLLARLPIHPSLGKMVVLGVIFRCLDPMLLLGAASEEKSLFLSPINARQEAQELHKNYVEGTDSDHIAFINAFREIRELHEQRGQNAAYSYCRQNFLHFGSFKTIDATARQIEEILVESGLIPNTPWSQREHGELGDPDLNRNSGNVGVVKALALAGLRPNLAINPGGRFFRTRDERVIQVHPSSFNHVKDRKRTAEPETAASLRRDALFTFTSLNKAADGQRLLMRDTTLLTPLMAVLFGGKLKQSNASPYVLEMDGWLPFYLRGSESPSRLAKTVLEFRKAFDRVLTSAFQSLSRLRYNDKGFLSDDPARENFAQGVVDVLSKDITRQLVAPQRTPWRVVGRDDRRNDRGGGYDGGRVADRWRPSDRPDPYQTNDWRFPLGR
ncbi:hypothetical protein LTR04_000294, partial [Oleoguttula sp. CCFEE 6159]